MSWENIWDILFDIFYSSLLLRNLNPKRGPRLPAVERLALELVQVGSGLEPRNWKRATVRQPERGAAYLWAVKNRQTNGLGEIVSLKSGNFTGMNRTGSGTSLKMTYFWRKLGVNPYQRFLLAWSVTAHSARSPALGIYTHTAVCSPDEGRGPDVAFFFLAIL